MNYLATVEEDDFLVLYFGGQVGSSPVFGSCDVDDSAGTGFAVLGETGYGGGSDPGVVIAYGKATSTIVGGTITFTPGANPASVICPILVLRFRGVSGIIGEGFTGDTGTSTLAEASVPANGIFADALWVSAVCVECSSGVTIVPNDDWLTPVGGREQGGAGATEVSLLAMYQFKTVDEDVTPSATIGSSKKWSINAYGWED